MWGHRVRKVRRVRQERAAPLVLSDLRESRGRRGLLVRRGMLAPPDPRVRLAQLVRKAFRGLQESKARLARQGQQVLRENRVQPDQRARMGPRESKDLPDHLVLKVTLAHRVKLALPDRKGRRGCRVSLELQGRRGLLARQERLDLKDLLDQLARLAEQR